MSKANSNPDILHAGDIMPPYNDKSNQEDNSRETKGSGQNTSSSQQKHAIPRFDLAEEILAEQRKIATVKRKAPSPVLSEQKQIIAEIVTRDIENLTK